jgi:hypothetical protein
LERERRERLLSTQPPSSLLLTQPAMSTPTDQAPITSLLTDTVKSTVGSIASTVQPGESELAKWRRTFDHFAGVEVDGRK